MLQVLGQSRRNLFRRHLRTETGQHLAIASHQKFGEIPRYVGLSVIVGLCCLEHLVEVTSAVAVDFNLCEHREIDVEFTGRKLEHFFVAAWFLCPKLITWKCQYSEVVGSLVFVQSTQPGVLGRESSAARDVDDETELVFEGGEINAFARNGFHGEIVKLSHA